MNDTISIVVPIYNVEKYLKQCVDTIINQTYKNLEIILVDDGSLDRCGDICDGYTDLDDRIQVIHKENGGLSDARNAGMAVATGKYITFIDSDDYISNVMIEELHKAIEKQSADVSVCFFQKIYGNGAQDEFRETDQIRVCYSGKELLRKLYTTNNSHIAFVAWNKLYRRDLFVKHGITYPKGKYHEDTFTTYKLLYYSSKVAVVKKQMYFYRIRGGSIMTDGFTEKRLDNLEAMQQEMDFYSEKEETELLTLALNRYYKVAILLYYEVNQISDEVQKETLKKKITGEYKNNWKRNANQLIIPVVKRIVYLMFCFHISRGLAIHIIRR